MLRVSFNSTSSRFARGSRRRPAPTFALRRQGRGNGRPDRGGLDRRTVLLFVGVGLLLAGRLGGQGADDVELRTARIKAAYIFKLINYIDWPAQAFASPDAPLRIGVVGVSSVTPNLEVIAKTKTANGRRLSLERVHDGASAAKCQILFVASTGMNVGGREAIQSCSSLPTLIVGEQDDFLSNGGVLNMVIEDNQVRLHLSVSAARLHQLKISSKLATIAKLVN